jgi:hypothetical protein
VDDRLCIANGKANIPEITSSVEGLCCDVAQRPSKCRYLVFSDSGYLTTRCTVTEVALHIQRACRPRTFAAIRILLLIGLTLTEGIHKAFEMRPTYPDVLRQARFM